MSVHVSGDGDTTAISSDRYLIVSTDSHVGPLVRDQLRDYCPKQYLEQYDEFLAAFEAKKPKIAFTDTTRSGGMPFTETVQNRTIACVATPGVYDPHQRVRDMDEQGVASEIVYHGAMTPDVIPFRGTDDRELHAVGLKIYNRWLADFVSVAPDRFIGAAELPMWDVDASVKEVEWAREAGLKCVNFPAPVRSLAPYNDRVYEPFWAACEATGLPLTTHGGGGDMPPYTGPEAWALYMSDLFFYSRRALWYLIWSGAFERHPGLKMVFVEQRADWVPWTLAHLDSIYHSDFHDWEQMIPRAPSSYFESNCYVASSFMARHEVEVRHQVGVQRLMWGTDYPHWEGTWGQTAESLRATFAGLPADEVRLILGENAVRCFGLDRAPLRAIADRIGPLPADLDRPLDAVPHERGLGFRIRGTWS